MSIECLQMGTKYKQHSVKGLFCCLSFSAVTETMLWTKRGRHRVNLKTLA